MKTRKECKLKWKISDREKGKPVSWWIERKGGKEEINTQREKKVKENATQEKNRET